MRDIKFRFYDTNTVDIWRYISLEEFLLAEEEYIDSSTFAGQYTGVKDSYGNEIYEGDILLLSHKKYMLSRYSFKVTVGFRGGGFKYYPDSKTTPLNFCGSWDTKVIGNIYESPEELRNEGN